AFETERRQVDARKQGLALAEQRERQVPLVDEAGVQVMPDGRDAAAHPTSLPAPPARASAAWMPSVTKWKVVPPFIAVDARGCCVSTNTGTWYGGVPAPQPPGPTPGGPAQ